MSLLHRIPRATAPAAIGSLVSLAAQGVFAVFLLKLFDAQAVGIFSVVSQIAFCWATLALAQSPLSLLANHQTNLVQAARQAWRQSLWRMLGLAPIMVLALHWSQGGMTLTGWVSLMALTQMSWLLAQSLTLRTQSGPAIALVRLTPPVMAALAAWACAQGLGATQASSLLLASLLGYSAGALWMRQALWPQPHQQHHEQHIARATPAPPGTAQAPPPSDPRSNRLKMLHTLTDVLCSTALAIQRQSLYGPAQAGYLLVLLRVFGFVPALVHTAWAQALIGRPQEQKFSALWVALAACTLITLLGLSLELALHWQWLQASWQNLRACLWPIALWQMAACLSAAHAHLPFWQGRTRQFSQQSIALNALMLSLLFINPALGLSATEHLRWIAGFMVLGLGLQTLYFLRQRR